MLTAAAEDVKEEAAEEEEEEAGEQDDIFELEGLTEAQMVQHLHVTDAAQQQQPHRSGWEGVATAESAADVRVIIFPSCTAALSLRLMRTAFLHRGSNQSCTSTCNVVHAARPRLCSRTRHRACSVARLTVRVPHFYSPDALDCTVRRRSGSVRSCPSWRTRWTLSWS